MFRGFFQSAKRASLQHPNLQHPLEHLGYPAIFGDRNVVLIFVNHLNCPSQGRGVLPHTNASVQLVAISAQLLLSHTWLLQVHACASGCLRVFLTIILSGFSAPCSSRTCCHRPFRVWLVPCLSPDTKLIYASCSSSRLYGAPRKLPASRHKWKMPASSFICNGQVIL